MSKRNYRLIPHWVIDVNSRLFFYVLSLNGLSFNDFVSDATSFQACLLTTVQPFTCSDCVLCDVMMVSLIWPITLDMMYYHDGLRIITAERARHSSILSGTPSWNPSYHWCCIDTVLIMSLLLADAPDYRRELPSFLLFLTSSLRMRTILQLSTRSCCLAAALIIHFFLTYVYRVTPSLICNLKFSCCRFNPDPVTGV
jgi:hypothetical protein